MDCKYKIKQITSSYDSCDKCGLPKITCICDSAPKISTSARIWILSTERELYRPSNTARLLKLVNLDSTEIFLWKRTKNPEKLIENLNNEIYDSYLVFPVEDKTKCGKLKYKSTGKIPAFVLIDGTWKEARKILRKSDYLNKLPRISLQPNFKSHYDLRKGAAEGDLCTIEAVVELLKINKEIENSKIIDEFYNLFLKSYKAGASGHKLKE
ncbi:tRNA-uridine aminocarboxypropyltransferase [Clostridium sp.]|uniref:tRNA-uridine aminocarboxypropyltransferase n=1 Tax=Clostridium sp. TaxID=1506 RepID=UPI003D6CCD13